MGLDELNWPVTGFLFSAREKEKKRIRYKNKRGARMCSPQDLDRGGWALYGVTGLRFDEADISHFFYFIPFV
jgi:hypothetical protein